MFESISQAALDFTNNLEDVTSKYIGLEAVIPTVSDMFGEQSQTLRELNKELGTSSKTSAALRKELAQLSRTTGFSTKSQLELLNVTKEYHQGLNDVTKANLSFAKASGASVDIIGKLSAKLTILKKNSESSFNSMYESILAVRDAYGLTNTQIEDITDSLIKYASVVGDSNLNMSLAAKNMSIFTSQLTRVGIEADTVSSIINNMLDPTAALDNIALLTKMGVSVNELMSGDPTQALESSTYQLKALGEQISSIANTNRFAAQQMADLYGLSLKDAIALKDIDTSIYGTESGKTLENYRQEMSTFSDNLQNFTSMIGGSLMMPLSTIGNILEGFTNTLSTLGAGVTAALTVVIGGPILKKTLGKLKKGLLGVVGDAAKAFYDQKNIDKFGSRLEIATGNAAKKFSSGMDDLLQAAQEKNNIKEKDVAGLRKSGGIETLSFETRTEAQSKLYSQERGKSNPINTQSSKQQLTLEKLMSINSGLDAEINEIQSAILSGANVGEAEKSKLQFLIDKRKAFEKDRATAIEQALSSSSELFSNKYSSFGGIRGLFTDDTALSEKDLKEQENRFNSNKNEFISIFKSILPPETFNSLQDLTTSFSDFKDLITKNNYQDLLSELNNKLEENKEAIEKDYSVRINNANSSEKEILEKEKNRKLAEIEKKQNNIRETSLSSIKSTNRNKSAEQLLFDLEKERTGNIKEANTYTSGNFKGIGKAFAKLSGASKNLSALSTKLKDGAIESFAASQFGNGQGIFKNIGGKFKGAGLSVAGGATSAASKTLSSLSKLPEKLLKGFGGLLKGFGIAGIGIVVSKIAEKFKESAKFQEISAKVSQKLQEIVTKVTDTLMPTFNTLISNIEGPISDLMDAVSNTLVNIVGTLAPAVSNLAQTLIPIAKTLVVALTPIIKIVSSALSGIINFINKVFSKFAKGITGSTDSVLSYSKQTAINTSSDDLSTYQGVMTAAEYETSEAILKKLNEMGERVENVVVNIKKTNKAIDEGNAVRVATA